MNDSSKRLRFAVIAFLGGTTFLPGTPANAQENRIYRNAAANTPQGARDSLPRAPENITLANARLRLNDSLLVASFVEQPDAALGATLHPVDPVLRAQLNIPAGQGLLVVALRGDGPSAQAGLKQNDILLSLADKPLATPDDLTRQLKAAGEAPVPLLVLRAGKQLPLAVRPIYRVTLGPVQQEKTAFYLGVSLKPADEALRAQLGLSEGVVVNGVVAGSPAEKAGVQKHDIVLAFADRVINSPEALEELVQSSRDQPNNMKLLRSGKVITFSIAPEARRVKVAPIRESGVFLFLDQPHLVDHQFHASADLGFPVTGSEQDVTLRRIEDLEKQVKGLRESLDNAIARLKANEATKR
jgi:C-terminal processing protease CtpA/Prc